MKQFLQISVLIFGSLFSKGQPNKAGFPFNAATGRIHITDSVKLRPGYEIFWCKELVSDWANRTAYGSLKKTLFWLPKGTSIGFQSIYESETEKGKYFKPGQLDHYSIKPNGRVDSSDKTNGTVGFKINFTMAGDFIILEFTDFHYSGFYNEIGSFEDEQLTGPDGVRHLSEREKPWLRIRRENYARLQLVCQDLKQYIGKHYKDH